MNERKSPSPRSLLIFPVTVFITVLALGFIFQDFLRNTVLVFFLYMFWTIQLAFESLGHRSLWILAVGITLVLTIRFSRQIITLPLKRRKSILQGPLPETRRIDFWRKRVKVMRRSVERDYYLADLHQLIIKTLAYHHQVNPESIKEQIRSGSLRLPSEVHEFLGVGEPLNGTVQQIGFIKKMKLRFHQFREGFKTQPNLPDPGLEKVAAYLESLLEDGDDI